jgi:hypothetical protein
VLEVEELAALGEEEVQEVAEADLFGVQAGVGFQTPLEVGTAPGSEVVTASGCPEESEGLKHEAGVDYTEYWRLHVGAGGEACALMG